MNSSIFDTAPVISVATVIAPSIPSELRESQQKPHLHFDTPSSVVIEATFPRPLCLSHYCRIMMSAEAYYKYTYSNILTNLNYRAEDVSNLARVQIDRALSTRRSRVLSALNIYEGKITDIWGSVI